MTDSFIDASYSLQPAAVDVYAVNLVPNPSFEVTYEPWDHGGGNATLSNNSTDAQFGAKAAKVFCNALGTTVFIDFPIPVDDTVYTASAYFRSLVDSGVGTTVDLQVAYWTDVTLGSFTGQAMTLSAGARTSLASTAPVGSSAVRVRLQVSSIADPLVFDAVAFTQGPSLLDYFDGDTADDASYTYDWTGTAHASPSTRTPVR